MFSKDTNAVCKRLLILALLSLCLVVFGSSVATEAVHATACIQDCQAQEAFCYDSCAQDCSGNGDAACNSCMSACASAFRSCARHAEWCQSGTVSYSPTCQIEFTDHCELDANGIPHCEWPSAHSGYTLICETLGGNHCVACPDESGWHCTGSNGLGACY
jgi:hypothetical protein